MTQELLPEYNVVFTSTTTTVNLAPFVDSLPDDVEYIKLRLNSFAFSLLNSGTDDTLRVSLASSADSQFILGDNTTLRNLLYQTIVYMATSTYATANDMGADTKYIILRKFQLKQPFSLTWTVSPVASGVGALQATYANVSLIPLKK